MVLSSFIIITIVTGMHIYLLFSVQYADLKSIEYYEFLTSLQNLFVLAEQVLFSTNQCSPLVVEC